MSVAGRAPAHVEDPEPDAAASADRATVNRFLDRAQQRMRLLALVRGACAGAVAGALLSVANTAWLLARDAGDTGQGAARTAMSGFIMRLALAMVPLLLGVVVALLRARTDRAHVASMVERRERALANRLVTAEELERVVESSVSGGIVALVRAQAAHAVRAIDLAGTFPVRRLARNAIAAVLVLLATLLLPASRENATAIGTSVRDAVSRPSPGIDRVDVTITAPRYTERAVQRASDPARLTALAGSRLAIVVRTRASALRVLTPDGAVTARLDGDTWHAELPVTTDGFVALEASDESGATTGRRLIGITAEVDGAPRVRIVAPARDLVLQDSTQAIALDVEAADDLALASLRLRYTKVSGSGERFTFEEGEVPLQLARRDARTWRASTRWALGPVGLAAGDMVVYRAVAADRRPGGAPSESETFIAQRLAAEGDAALGFAVDPDEERQALSQQMVVLKTERLLGRRRTLSDSAFAEEAAGLAIEQRRVRAEFVFMMGGEMSEAVAAENSMDDLDETHEAESETDLSAGRMANQGRTALLAAIRAMSRAAAALTAGDAARALPEERRAVAEIERAFARSRYLLRALAQREQLDLARRGTGTLTDARGDTRTVRAPPPDARAAALRGAFAALVAHSLPRSGERGSAALSAVAERVLRADPSSGAVQGIADALNDASRAMAAGRTDDARRRIERASIALGEELRRTTQGGEHRATGGGTPSTPSIEARRVTGATTGPPR